MLSAFAGAVHVLAFYKRWFLAVSPDQNAKQRGELFQLERGETLTDSTDLLQRWHLGYSTGEASGFEGSGVTWKSSRGWSLWKPQRCPQLGQP
jgi:hypothetical protein